MWEILSEYWYVFFLALLPVAELRGAIPAGIAMGLEPWSVFVVAGIANLLPVPLIILSIRQIMMWMKRREGFLRRVVVFLERKADKGSKMFYRYELLGLCILVAIPLPGTGAWTGALVASVLRLRLKTAFPAIALGVIIAGVLVLVLSCGVSFVLT